MRTRRQILQDIIDRRLGELDTTDGGNLTRAIRYNSRRAELSIYKIYGAYIYPTRQAYGGRWAAVGPVYSYS